MRVPKFRKGGPVTDTALVMFPPSPPSLVNLLLYEVDAYKCTWGG